MQDLNNKIQTLKQEYIQALANAVSHQDLENIRIKYLSRSGDIAQLMQCIKDLTKEQKIIFGPQLNEFKVFSENAFNEKKTQLEAKFEQDLALRKNKFDVSAYDPNFTLGSLHPYSYVIEKIENVFISMGYSIVNGPELEDDFHNFEALNIPAQHPARDMQDTFWINLPKRLMRTHTSTIQIRAMEKQNPPLAMLAIGRCYRNEATDATHDFVFMQAECLVIDKNISVSNLLATIKVLLNAIFEKNDLQIRTRPGYFPFVEPGLEVDLQCPFCTNGCSVCKRTRWIEMGGSGLVHPNVLKNCNIDPEIYSGFAFGFGLTRLVMLKYGINDVRLLNSARIDFLEQF